MKTEEVKRVRRSLQPGERELIEDLVSELRQMDGRYWPWETHEANLLSLLPEIQLGDDDRIYLWGRSPIKVNRNPPSLANIVSDLESLDYRFTAIRRQHGFWFEWRPLGRSLVREVDYAAN